MLSSKPENWSFYVVVLTSTGEKCTKMRAARVARSFFPLLSPGQTDSQVDASSQLASTCDYLRLRLTRALGPVRFI